MKFSRASTFDKSHRLPALRFEEQQLTSFSGLIIFQQLFALLDLRGRLRLCFRHLKLSPIFGHARIVLVLIMHLLLGYRQLRELRFYADDPLVKRVVGLKRLPDVATVSRALAGADAQSVGALQRLLRELVLQRLAALGPASLTLDFDGSVLGTGRFAEGTAVGFNRKKKGQRSYYPLFCTIAQSAQVLDVLQRSGNVHDSNGAEAFIRACIEAVRTALPGVRIETRMDAAFFSDAIVQMLDAMAVEYTISVPFERLSALKEHIEQRRHWRPIAADCASFELRWKPKSWQRRQRFLVIRKRVKLQSKEPVQLDLFAPFQYGHEFKVILTNKRLTPAKVLAFHNGRGAQEGIFAELKSDNALAYVPTRTWIGNQIYLIAALMAHNLARELQMRAQPPARSTTAKRSPLWPFASIATLRRQIIQRAGRLIRPQGQLILSMSANDAVKHELLYFLDILTDAA
jgi:Transposase DDE domain group 1